MFANWELELLCSTFLSVNGTCCSQIGHLGTDFAPFFYAFQFGSEMNLSFVNEANNRAHSDLLGQVWLLSVS